MTPGDILTFYEMCAAEQLGMLQRGMTFRAPPSHGVILMSQRRNAPYDDILDDAGNLIYEGHDEPRSTRTIDPKSLDQPRYGRSGRPTENGKFADWTDQHKAGEEGPALFRVYEKLKDGIWSYRGLFALRDYRYEATGVRNVFRFVLQSVDEDGVNAALSVARLQPDEAPSRTIPTWVKQYVYKRDKGRCVLCGSNEHLHFDHDLPYSRGGASATPDNVRLLCQRHNLEKGARIE